MTETLLATKFYIPPLLENIVHRPRLLDKLDQGLSQGCRLTLISAPAGYGKTTLLGEWLRHTNLPAAWLSLDEGDNDPARFTVYLINALRKVIPTCGETSLVILDASGMQDPAAVLTPLINDMAAHSEPFLVILDDFHIINSQAVQNSLAFLLENAPPQAHFVLTTRSDPLLPIPRLRGRGQVTEIRQEDLRFSDDEAAQVINILTGLELGKEGISSLNSRTEGWAAGLRMAAASLSDQRDASTFIKEFTGSNRYILDYLIEEVLAAQPENIQDFLLHTSILKQLCASLCDAVIHQLIVMPTSSQDILENLERKNLFIFPLDEKREWYRYHRLFSDLLRQRLVALYPTVETELHRRASRWYEQHDLNDFAIDHAISSGDAQRAADLIEGLAETTLMKSQVTTLYGWLEQLPDAEIQKRPELSIYYAWILLWSGAPLEAIEAHLEATTHAGDSSAKSLPLQAFLAIFHNEIERSVKLARQALDQLPEENMLLRSLANFILASAYMAEGDSSEAVEILEETGRISQRAGNLMIAVLVLCELGDLRVKQGHLHDAKRLYQQALDLAVDAHGQRLPVAGKPLIGLGDLAREWNDLHAAEQTLLEGIELAEHWSVLGAFEGYLNLVMVWDALGRKDKADRMFAKLRQLAVQFDASEIDDVVVEMFAARRDIAWGNLERARYWADQSVHQRKEVKRSTDAVVDILMSRLKKYEDLVLGRLLVSEGRYGQAMEILYQVVREAKRTDRKILLIEAETQLSVALHACGRESEALASITRALSIAEPEGMLRIFVDQGQEVQALLEIYRQEIEQPELGTYVDRLLQVFNQKQTVREPIQTASHEISGEPLSDRELEVLQLLPSDLSSTEMAGELAVSVNTLRTHLKHIYAKLDAHSRYEAIARARDSGLL